MTQIPLSDRASAVDPVLDRARDDHTHEVAPDIAYRRPGIVNVAFLGLPAAGDRGWILVDGGLGGTAGFIRSAAQARYGEDARPAAILLTHGHFDHVGALDSLLGDRDVPVYAHPLELPYLTGQADYPPGDPSVGAGLMARLARLMPSSGTDLGARVQPLPRDGSIPVPGAEAWRWLHTPGHSVGHVSFWRAHDRALIAGDAVITTGRESAYAVAVQAPEMHGPPTDFTTDWAAAAASARRLAALEPALLVSGHGQAKRGPLMREAPGQLAAMFEEVAVPRTGRYVERPATAETGTAWVQRDRD